MRKNREEQIQSEIQRRVFEAEEQKREHEGESLSHDALSEVSWTFTPGD